MLHDFNDPFLEGAKLARYFGSSDGSTAMFVAFVVGWFATRLWLFPVRVIRSTLLETKVCVCGGVYQLYGCMHTCGTTSQ